MRSYLSQPPGWLVAVLAGGIFGVGMGLAGKFDGASWLGAGLMATSGIPFGLVMARWASRRRRGWARLEKGVPADKLRAARLAASAGPVPTDPEVRAAAERIASHELAELTRHPWFKVLVGGLMLFATVASAVAGSPWALLYGLVAAAGLYTHWYRPRQLRHRIAQLRTTE